MGVIFRKKHAPIPALLQSTGGGSKGERSHSIILQAALEELVYPAIDSALRCYYAAAVVFP